MYILTDFPLCTKEKKKIWKGKMKNKTPRDKCHIRTDENEDNN